MMMDMINFLMVAAVSTMVAAGWLFVTRIFPAFKAAKIQESLVSLTRCLAHLSRGPLAEATLTNGEFLHDKFYKLSFMVLTHKVNLKFSMLHRLTSRTEFKRSKFHREMEALDPEIRQLVDLAIIATAKILWLRNPVIFTMSLLKQWHMSREPKSSSHRAALRTRAIRSTESMALMGSRVQDYEFVPIVAR